jgi:chromosome segregation ATPase
MMGRKIVWLRLSMSLALLLPAAAAHADAATETALRAALQQATSQIADLENQVANLQASEAPDTAMIEALKAQVQTLQKSAPAPAVGAASKSSSNPASQKELAALRRELAARDLALGTSRDAYAAAAAAADAKTAANAKLSNQLATLTSRANSCEAKNAVLFKLGNQILDAYAHKDDVFGTIADREPFIGFKRVQLQNIVQDDQQTMLDNQIAPDQSGR